MTRPTDHFSGIAAAYARGRFGYPASLFAWLATQCQAHDLAWDCATGSGQAVAQLAPRFTAVVATDISDDLLARAPRIANVTYVNAPAEQGPLPVASADLITVAQALHWFDLERFWAEARRVAKPGGILSFWGYTWPRVDAVVDAQMMALRQTLSPHWPERSSRLHDEYRTVTAPFTRIAAPAFEVAASWQRADYVAHVASWSSVKYYRERVHADPLGPFEAQLSRTWPDHVAKPIRWPLHLQVYRID
jgi:ubiquinone/menaquinone biosynthesis C-methylase UbiE